MMVELFPCSGGMAEGFRRAGIEFDLAVDVDPDAVASYEANLHHRPVQMDVRDLLRLVSTLGWRPQHEIQLLVADPPCTPWSRAGKRRGQDDERDVLGETVALIEALRPAAWLIANVPGLDDSNHWEEVVQPVVGRMAQRAGYCVDYVSLDAADYGVPQRRRRPFWFGHRAGTPCIRWPAPTHANPSTMVTETLPGLERLRPWVTCREALGHLPADELGTSIRLRWRDGADHRPSDPDEPSKTQTTNPNCDGALLVHPKHPVCEIDLPTRTVTARDRAGSYMSDGVKLSEKARAILQGFPEESVVCEQCGERRWVERENGQRTAIIVAAQSVTSDLVSENSSMSPFGKRATAQYRAESKFTTEMATKPTTRSKTSKFSRQQNTSDVTMEPSCATESGGCSVNAAENTPGLAIGISPVDTCGDISPVILPTSHDEKSACENCGGPLRLDNGWQFLAKTKTARSSMIGQAMPPPLAEVVARRICVAMNGGRENVEIEIDKRGSQFLRHRTRSATLSECRKFRYTLGRMIASPFERVLLFVMLNPSTADALEDDPTIRKCAKFARDWKFEQLEVVNLYAYRASKPADLKKAGSPVGPLNDVYLLEVAAKAEEIVCAWGAHADAARAEVIIGMLRNAGHGSKLRCFGLTKYKQPRHPLFIAGDAKTMALETL